MGVPTYLSSEKLTLRVGVPTYLYWILTPDCLPTVHLNRTQQQLKEQINKLINNKSRYLFIYLFFSEFTEMIA